MSLSILIADDDLLYRTLLIKTIEGLDSNADITSCPDAFKTLDLVKVNKYDLVILDINMPVLNGIDVLEKLNDVDKNLVKVLTSGSSITQEQEEKAIELGVFAFIPKPSESDAEKNFEVLTSSFKAVIAQISERVDKDVEEVTDEEVIDITDTKAHPITKQKYHEPLRYSSLDISSVKDCEIVLIAISTGGPKLLEKIFAEMKGLVLTKPLVIVQHMPAGFTSFFVDSLIERHGFDFVEIDEGQMLEKKIYIAKGGYHAVLENEEGVLKWTLDEGPQIKGLRPAADITFKSLAHCYAGRKTLSIVLTGLGNDGTDGVRALKDECQHVSFVQDPNDCIATGMPVSIIKESLADYKLTVSQISLLLKEVL